MVSCIRKPSFVYEDLVSHVQTIRNQAIDLKNILDKRCQKEKNLLHELKSRSLTFVDPYGNLMKDNHLDHEIINKITKKYKKDFVPKYLQSWIEIGTINENTILPLTDFQLKSSVSNYANDHQFIAYGQVNVWIGGYKHCSPYRFDLRVLLTDNMEKIKSRITQLGQFYHMQLKLLKMNENTKPNETSWNEGTTFQSDDTILSCQLYKNDYIIMGNIGEDKESDKSCCIYGFHLFIKTQTKTTFLYVFSSMTVEDVKELIQNREDIDVDSQRLIYNGRQLDEGRTLSDYNIRQESTMFVVERLRGGMYHLTSGRQDFDRLTSDSAEAVKKVLKFKTKSKSCIHRLSSIELQEYILQLQNILSILYSNLQHVYVDVDIPDLKDIIFPTIDT